MLKNRIIPCLDVKNGRVVKGINFVDLKDAGDPVEQAKIYSDGGADEICFLDITASNENRETIYEVVEKTSKNTGLNLIFALSYSSRLEIISAVKSITTKVLNKEIKLEDIDSDVIDKHLYTNSIPDPDLLIRTSGEQRISNFLLWQVAYSELHFTPVLWPDFKQADLFTAVIDYQQRERRFGKTSEQIKK